MSAGIRVRGLAWPILERLGRLDSSSNLDGPTKQQYEAWVCPDLNHQTAKHSVY